MDVDNCSGTFTGAHSPTGSTSSSSCDFDVASPTQLLALAIKKRRNLFEDKQRDYHRELLHSHLIQNLCKFLGEGRARVRRQRRRCSSRRKLVVKRRRWDDASGTGEERERDQVVPDSRASFTSPNLGIAFESTVQTETDVGDDGGGGRGRQRVQNCSMGFDSEGDAPPRKRKRKESCEDDFTLFDLDDENREHQKFDGSVAKNGRVL